MHTVQSFDFMIIQTILCVGFILLICLWLMNYIVQSSSKFAIHDVCRMIACICLDRGGWQSGEYCNQGIDI